MPQKQKAAPSAVDLPTVLGLLPTVQSTAVNLSSYREMLVPIAEPGSHWLGILAPETTQTANDGFYPLVQIAELRLPSGDQLGQLRDLVFLKTAHFIYNTFLDNGFRRN